MGKRGSIKNFGASKTYNRHPCRASDETGGQKIVEMPGLQEMAQSLLRDRGTTDRGFTTLEMARAAGISKSTVLRLIRRGIADGRYLKGQGLRLDEGGRFQPTPVYQLKETK